MHLEEVSVVGPEPAEHGPGGDLDMSSGLSGTLQVTGDGSSLHLAGCSLWGGAHDAVLVADEGGPPGDVRGLRGGRAPHSQHHGQR